MAFIRPDYLSEGIQRKSVDAAFMQPEASAMRSLIQNSVSFFEKQFQSRQLLATVSRSDAIVSGYSYAFERYRQETLAENCNRQQGGIFLVDVAYCPDRSGADVGGPRYRLIEAMAAINACIASTRGRVVHIADARLLARFEGIDRALGFAINVQLANRRIYSNLNSAGQPQLQIGVHCGEAICDQIEIYKKMIFRAARLERHAHSGGICISESARSHLRDQSPISLFPLGKRYVKNINVPVEAFWIMFSKELIVAPNRIDTGTLLQEAS